MGFLRNRGEDRRRFVLREKLLSISDDYWVEDEHGERVYKVDGKALRLRDTWHLEDGEGNVVATIREKAVSLRGAIAIEAGAVSAVVKPALVSLRPKLHVEVDGGNDLEVHGNLSGHEYEIERDGDTVAEISKKWFAVRDTYGVEIDDDVDPALILAVTVAVDALEDGRREADAT